MLLLVCLVLIISRLESQNKFQILNYIPAVILVYHRCTPTWRFVTGQCKFLGNIYDEYLKFEETHRLKTWRSALFSYLL